MRDKVAERGLGPSTVFDMAVDSAMTGGYRPAHSLAGANFVIMLAAVSGL